jgi:hypothetical protein
MTSHQPVQLHGLVCYENENIIEGDFFATEHLRLDNRGHVLIFKT